ncbi:hypothetical protein EHI8A_074910 [Entamoeba histolytica HM-1:IMSS-B]|uniref:Uncharacterized protein n=6 Tax=Entamoeba histolytica TaxID=5759 RepID=C4M716_ENTH1|nr:hypothetical protein EHI_189980 [Entamoeba histolytica HM-1:IMSS]EMD48125.1 Hypothetical protein EHI5A_049800 [Entamoeba histolytica KU27]EMH73001.1 hypothetical protein EHI8A_074910 [Entamoeba histolytica HM-1:IMSS-B]EMS13364.1 hypothetical protein KM1_059400 [Entamoeba histolytica HM-3:IMSS]ENY60267.1 hypothetical protein EHI7A_027240 [Entamoeba histolytica HM-1:IMSS-A]GAT97307.1 hypothetical protein CL6EHI_189980 [Entamoeba histolytica]|eukprot:XP_652332.1 hypothetical protein EHI_189980 [Entamoeba histolytica HM-1:IMSS]
MEDIDLTKIEKNISTKVKNIIRKYNYTYESWENLISKIDMDKRENKELKNSVLENTEKIKEKEDQINKLKASIEAETRKKEKEKQQSNINRKSRESIVQEVVLSQKTQNQNIEDKTINEVPSYVITNTLNNSFQNSFIFNLYYEARQVDIGNIIWSTLSSSLILFETEELKYFGIFMNKSFFFLNDSMIKMVQPNTFNYFDIHLNNEQPYLFIDNYFYLFKKEIIINDIENHVNPLFKQVVRSWMTNQIDTKQATIKIRRVFIWNVIQLI